MIAERAATGFQERFPGTPRVFVAPGRVNIIGEHTDYNGGFALPAAIDRYTAAAVAPANTDVVRIYSRALDEEIEIPVREPFAKSGTWRDYAAGVVAAVNEVAPLAGGADVYVDADVPLGGGLSSSASFELALAQALFFLNGAVPNAVRLAETGMQAEHEFVGIRSGAMDQLVSALGVAGSALLLDCRTLETIPVALPAGIRIAVIDSLTKHGLVSSEYNARRAECERAVEELNRHGWGISDLRDVGLDRLSDAQRLLEEPVRRRVRHVVTENARVKDVVAAFATNDLAAVGKAMEASHDSLRADYEVTTEALDLIAAEARSVEGVVGARMTGGGFGGCVVALLEDAAFPALRERMTSVYYSPRGLEPSIFLTEAVNGAHEISLTQ